MGIAMISQVEKERRHRVVNRMDITGFIKRADYKNCLIEFSPMGLFKTIKLDIFTGNKRLSWFTPVLRKKLIEIIMEKRGQFQAKGYCYNSNIFIPDEIRFEFPDKIEHFTSIAQEVKYEN